MYNQNYQIQLTKIVESMINSGVLPSCFSNIPDCPGQSNPTIIVSSGGCYYYEEEWVLEDDGLAHWYQIWHPCDPNAINYCYTHQTICKEFINGVFVYHITNGSPAPQFNCNEGCIKLCDSK